MLVLIIVGVVGLLVWIVYVQSEARQQADVRCALDVVGTTAVVESFFGKTWKRVPGPGRLNARQRLKRGAPVLSVDWASSPQGGTEVSVWVSDFTVRTIGGLRFVKMMDHAQYAWRKKRQLGICLGRQGEASLRTGPSPSQPARDSRPISSPTDAVEKVEVAPAGASHSAPAAWYEDPTGRFEVRYWDGKAWSGRVASGGREVRDPIPGSRASAATTDARHEIGASRTTGTAQATFLQAAAHERAGDVPAAIDALKRVVASGDPTVAAPAAMTLAGLLEGQGDLAGAEAANRTAARMGGGDFAARALVNVARIRLAGGDTTAAERMYEKAAKLGHPEESPCAWANLGAMREDRGDLEGAIEAYEQAIQSEHRDHANRAYVNLGLLYQRRGNLREAQVNYTMAIKANHAEETPRAWLMLGYLWESNGDDTSAIRAFEDVIRSGHPARSAAAWVALGGIRLRQGDKRLACEAFQHALDVAVDSGESARAAIMLGITKKQLGDRTGALAAFRHARSVGPADIAQQAAGQIAQLGG